MAHYRVVVEFDLEPDFSHLSTTRAEYLRDGPYLGPDGQELDWEAYLSSYGDPANYAVYWAALQQETRADEWETVDSIGGCDVLNTLGDLTNVYYRLADMPDGPDGIRWVAETYFPDFQ